MFNLEIKCLRWKYIEIKSWTIMSHNYSHSCFNGSSSSFKIILILLKIFISKFLHISDKIDSHEMYNNIRHLPKPTKTYSNRSYTLQIAKYKLLRVCDSLCDRA